MEIQELFISEEQKIRFTTINNVKWFVFKDIMQTLNLKNTSDHSKKISANDKQKMKLITGSGQNMIFTNENGVQQFLQGCRSNNVQTLLNVLSRHITPIIQVKYVCKETSCMRIIQKSFERFSPVLQYSVGRYRIDLYFPEHKIAVECDEFDHKDRTNEVERQQFIENELKCYFVRFNPDENDFNIGNTINKLLEIFLNRLMPPTNIERIPPTKSRKNIQLLPTKPCSRCKIIKSLDNFYYAGEHRDKTENTCKPCVKERQDEHLLKARETIVIPDEKICNICENIKPLEDFYRDKNAPDGRMRRCQTCHNKKQKTPRTVVNITEKCCTTCGIEKPVSEFGKNSRSTDGYKYECKPCLSNRAKTRYQEKQGNILQKKREYRVKKREENKT